MAKQPSQSGASAVLSQLWAKIVRECNISPSTLDYMLELYIQRTLHRPDEDDPTEKGTTQEDLDATRTQRKGNLRRGLTSPKMTFKVFCKGIEMLAVVNMKVKVELTMPYIVTEHEIDMHFIGNAGSQNSPSISSPMPHVVKRRSSKFGVDVPKQYELVE